MNNPFRLISTKKIYENSWVRLDEDTVERDGKTGIFGITTLHNGACVLVVDEGNVVLLIKEYKYALGKEDINLPGGAINIGESPLDCAKRETEEEIGYAAEEWMSLGHIHPLTTTLKQTENLFLARKLRKTQKHTDEWEDTKVLKVPFEKALEMVMNSEITHSGSVAAILKAQKYIEHAS